MSGHPGAVLCGQYHGAVDHAVKGHGQLFVGYPIFVKGHHFLAARKTPTSYAPGSRRFQPGEGPSRGLLRDCTPSPINRFAALILSVSITFLGLMRSEARISCSAGVPTGQHHRSGVPPP